MTLPPIEFDMAGCLARVRECDETAARALVMELRPLVLKIVRAHLPRRSDEDDLAQEIFLKMFSRLDQYRGPLPFAHWVSRIAVTTCLDALRSERRRPELRWADLSEAQAAVVETLHGAAPSESPRTTPGASELVENLLATLSPRDRLLITLLDLEGRSVAEVSAQTGWNRTVVKVRAFRARRFLRRTLAALEKTSPAAGLAAPLSPRKFPS